MGISHKVGSLIPRFCPCVIEEFNVYHFGPLNVPNECKVSVSQNALCTLNHDDGTVGTKGCYTLMQDQGLPAS